MDFRQLLISTPQVSVFVQINDPVAAHGMNPMRSEQGTVRLRRSSDGVRVQVHFEMHGNQMRKSLSKIKKRSAPSVLSLVRSYRLL